MAISMRATMRPCVPIFAGQTRMWFGRAAIVPSRGLVCDEPTPAKGHRLAENLRWSVLLYCRRRASRARMDEACRTRMGLPARPRPATAAAAISDHEPLCLLSLTQSHNTRCRRVRLKARREMASGLMRQLTGWGVAAASIKFGGAGLAYLTILSVAKATDSEQFGYFSTAWAAFNILAMVGALGQQSVAIKMWPVEDAVGDRRTANGYVVRSMLVAAIGRGSTAPVPLSLPILAPHDLNFWLCIAVAALTILFGWSEVISGALRGRGSVLLALVPRDILWRLTIISVIVPIAAGGVTLSAFQALLVVTLPLIVLVVVQTTVLTRFMSSEGSGELTPAQLAKHWKTTQDCGVSTPFLFW